ncbi:MAG TPA: glutamine synthetase family protein [Verrucomicrobiae bacterium]|nr:glutamine synthetase family protein [Verrucomicrobiae bacterium]
MNLPTLKTKIAAGEIDTIITVFPDVFGRLVGKRFTGKFFLDHVAGHGTHGCNYLLTVNLEMDPMDGFQLANWDKGFGDFHMAPDLATLRVLPWQPGTALVLCDLRHETGAPVAEAPRSVLRRQLEAVAARKWVCYCASELEFFLFNQAYHDLFVTDYRNLVPSSDYRIDYHTMQPTRDEPILRAVRNGMSAAGVPVESSKGEWGRGQHEVNFVYDQPVPMADMHVVFKQGMKEIAAQYGKAVTFMPKLAASEVGSSCHIHISLWRGGRNAFWDAKAKAGSALFRQFLGGLMKYSPELCYFFAPTINSYKRYQAASWAPTKMAWSHDNRTVGFRVVGQGDSFRIENRMPGADANPYLAFAAMLAAGLAGVEEQLDCGKDYCGNAYVDPKLRALPRTLREAAVLLDQSKLARGAFGDPVVNFYVHTARLEVQAFDDAVTDWERARYFERI